jgi:hypothetical protein
MKKFINISTCNNWTDYHDEDENLWRREEVIPKYHFYKVFPHGLVFQGSMSQAKGIEGIERTHQRFLKEERNVVIHSVDGKVKS